MPAHMDRLGINGVIGVTGDRKGFEMGWKEIYSGEKKRKSFSKISSNRPFKKFDAPPCEFDHREKINWIVEDTNFGKRVNCRSCGRFIGYMRRAES